MMNLEAVVIELSEDNEYRVYLGGMDYRTVTDNGEFDDSVVSFESALSTIIELFLTDDYEYVERKTYKDSKGRCRKVFKVTLND